MKKRSFLQSINDATSGFIYVVKHERNMRIHFLIGFLVLLAGVVLGIKRLDWIILCTVVTLVLVAEMFNTAIEETLDFLEANIHPSIRNIKNMSAGAVLVCSLNALVVGFFIFTKYLSAPFENMAYQVEHTSWHVTFFALVTVLFLVVFGKAFFRWGTPFRGGAISGHSAIAFGLWVAILLTQSNLFVSSATLMMALLVAQSRLRAKIHSLWEVIFGAALGFLVMALFFEIFK